MVKTRHLPPTCGHGDRTFSKGLCRNCYTAAYKRRRRAEVKPTAKPVPALPILHRGPIHHGEVFEVAVGGIKGPRRWYVWDHTDAAITLRSDFTFEEVHHREVDEARLRTHYRLTHPNPKGTAARPAMLEVATC